jgi:hypothetical protein
LTEFDAPSLSGPMPGRAVLRLLVLRMYTCACVRQINHASSNQVGYDSGWSTDGGLKMGVTEKGNGSGEMPRESTIGSAAPDSSTEYRVGSTSSSICWRSASRMAKQGTLSSRPGRFQG